MHPGAIVGDTYLVEDVVSVQGMGSVYRARNSTGQVVAIKTLACDVHRNQMRFAREVATLRTLQHPTIVRYLDSGTDGEGRPFLVMEWLDGEDLKHFLEKRRITLAQTLEWAGRIAEALATAHRLGVVHRDIKPGNIFLPAGDVARAKLIDFGIAFVPGMADPITVSGRLTGTPAYMAPEQVRGDGRIDASADVFALGCVIFECLAGNAPFAARNPTAALCKILLEPSPRLAEAVPDIPPPVDDLVAKMLAKDPDQRLGNGIEVMAALDRVTAALGASDHNRAVHSTRVPERLTEHEQRWISVILVRGDGSPDSVMDETQPTIELVDRYRPAAPVTEIADTHFEAVGDGSLVAIIDSKEAATDQACQAARVALAARRDLPGRDIALATGRTQIAHRRRGGEIIERAVELLSSRDPSGESSGDHGILLDELTAELLDNRFEIHHAPDGPLVLSGAQPFHDQRTVLGRITPFVGRRRELANLQAILDHCINEHVAHAMLIIGPPGRGKSRLCHEFLRLLDDRDSPLEIWLGQGDSMHAGSPLYIVAQLMRRLVDFREGEPLPSRQRNLARVVAERIGAIARASPDDHHDNADTDKRDRITEFLGELVGTPSPGRHSVQLRAALADPMLMGSQIQNAVEELAMAVTEERPLIVVLEDLHWGDHATVALFDRLLRNLVARPFLLVAFARTEIDQRFPRIWADRHLDGVRLAPLGQRDATALARSVLGDGIADSRITALVERAGGNPFYLEELVRSAASDRWDWPETVLAMVQARLEALEPRSRRILRAASLFGGRFWRGGIATLVGDDQDEWLERLVEQEWITESSRSRFSGQSEYAFRHGLVREAAYAMLTDDDRVLGHRLAGKWLEHIGEDDPRSLAAHFEAGDLPDRAQTYYVRAAEAALERSDLDAARDLAARGIACGADGVTLGTLKHIQADVASWQQPPAELARLYGEAMALLPRGTRSWFDTAGEVGLALLKLGAHDRVVRLAERLRDDVKPRSGDVAAQNGRRVAMAKLATQLYLHRAVETADSLVADLLPDHTAQARERASEAVTGRALRSLHADPVVAAHAHLACGCRAHEIDGSPERALQHFERAIECFEQVGNRRKECLNRGNLGYVKGELGLHGAAESDLRRALDTAHRLGLEMAAASAQQKLAVVLARQPARGLDEALEMARLAAAWYRDHDNTRMAGWSVLTAAQIVLQRGELASAERQARLANELLAHDQRNHGAALAVLSRIYAARDQPHAALRLAEEASRAAGAAIRPREYDALIRLIHAEAVHATGDRGLAHALIRAAHTRLLQRADTIETHDWRSTFLHNIPEHARTLELAQAWAEDSIS